MSELASSSERTAAVSVVAYESRHLLVSHRHECPADVYLTPSSSVERGRSCEMGVTAVPVPVSPASGQGWQRRAPIYLTDH